MEINNKENGNFFLANIDGKKCQTWEFFLKEIGIAFNFPEYYGHNLAAFRDCINDLSWIKQDNYMLIIENSDLLLKEGLRSDDRLYIIKQFDKIIHNWSLGPDAEGNDETRKKSDFIVIYN